MMIEYLILFSALTLAVVALSNALWWPRVRDVADAGAASVSVLIPARNEEHNLAACLDSVLRQGTEVREVLVCDDHSTDRTPQIIRAYTAMDGRVKSVEAGALPPGWCGKNFACARLAQAARSEWLLFLDADARLLPRAAARMVVEAESRRVTFLSCWPGLVTVGFWEKALMPMLNFVVFSLYPSPLALLPSDRFQRDARFGLAHGACLLIHRRSYEEFGGHAAVKGEIFEDTRLAQLWRADGRRGLCLDGQHVVRLRMYTSFGEIRRGFEKNFYPAFRHESSFWLFLALHGFVFLSPFLFVIHHRSAAVIVSIVAVLAARSVLALRFSHPIISIVLHPLGEVILLLVGLSSWLRCRRGRGVEWKGRQYHRVVGH